MRSPLTIASGEILVYRLFNLADTVDLEGLRQILGEATSVARFTSRRPAPPHFQYRTPPLTLTLGTRSIHLEPDRAMVAQLTAKIYDFGVLSLRWSIPCPSEWEELVAVSGSCIDNPHFETLSRQVLAEVQPRLAPALKNPPREVMLEEYTIFMVHAFGTAMSAAQLLDRESATIAQLIRGEGKRLANQEQSEVLRSRVSYFADDMAVIDWNAAFIYDSEGGTEHIDTLEFANAELLEFRYFDRTLDDQLDEIYQGIERGQALPRWRIWLTNDYSQTRQRLMAITMDVIELTEQIENALKFIGDLYSARIYRAISERLRLKEWEDSIDGKVRTAQEVYQMLSERVDTRRSFVLEVVVILLIAFEILMAFARH